MKDGRLADPEPVSDVLQVQAFVSARGIELIGDIEDVSPRVCHPAVTPPVHPHVLPGSGWVIYQLVSLNWGVFVNGLTGAHRPHSGHSWRRAHGVAPGMPPRVTRGGG